jgi:hypothetical protein
MNREEYENAKTRSFEITIWKYFRKQFI